MTDSLFLKILNDKFKSLKDFIIQKKMKLFIPSSAYVLEGHFVEHFYNNHIYYQSPFDDSIYINLNGKTLKNSGNTFTSAFGWQNSFSFSIKDTLTTSSGINCITIDGVCYEEDKPSKKASTTLVAKDEKYKQYLTKEEYIKNYKPLFDNEDIESQFKIYDQILSIIFKYRNNYVLMKGYEDYYGSLFVGDVIPLFEIMGNELRKLNMDENVIDVVKYELIDSLIFEKLYDFIFHNLQMFYEKEEIEVKRKMQQSSTRKFEFVKENEPYRECKFKEPIEKLKELKTKKSLFEKVNLIIQVNNDIGVEAKEVYEKETKKKYNPHGDLLIALWSNVIEKAEVENLLAEISFLKNFNFYAMKTYGEESYLVTTFITAVTSVYNEYMGDYNKKDVGQHIQMKLIETGWFGLEKKK